LDLCPECFAAMVERKTIFNANDIFIETGNATRVIETTVEG
jgi:hypothetical protein